MKRAFITGAALLIAATMLAACGGLPEPPALTLQVAEAAGAAPAVSLRAASGATIQFSSQNGQTRRPVAPQTREVPHLVLYRNDALTAPAERTLIVEVTQLAVPPAGVTVALEVRTEHGDPDPGAGDSDGILVWREALSIDGLPGVTQLAAVVWHHEFAESVPAGTGSIATPTDYLRYDVTVVDSSQPGASPLWQVGQDHAFLMERQWVVRLPPVMEESAGAAPAELLVFACDMFPFRKSADDPTTWIPRGQVPATIRGELIPAMVEAFRVQTDEWGFPWHAAWTSSREEAGSERLSVALTDGETWYHGRAPSGGNSSIALSLASADHAHYDTLTDGLMSIFHHELLHNLQRNLNLQYGGNGELGGSDDAWQYFSEGTAVLASAVGQPEAQFGRSEIPRAYMLRANNSMRGAGVRSHLNQSVQSLDPYMGALYWRFLYEQCGGMQDGVENPAAGMRVIRRALVALYTGEIVNISQSSDLVGSLPAIMNQALQDGSCPFVTYEASLAAFAEALYALRLAGGRCSSPGFPAGCQLYDPNQLYIDSPASLLAGTASAGDTITYTAAEQTYPAGIRCSFGMDFVEMELDASASGRSLALDFYGAPGSEATFVVRVWKLLGPDDSGRFRPATPHESALVTLTGAGSHLSATIPAADTAGFNRLAWIITRVDGREGIDPVGEYTIVLQASGAATR